MEIVIAPQEEEQVLRPVDEEANTEEIREALISKTECCVDHLCGCK